MNNPKISVIVPVYNVEKYLSKCIESILAQTFTDFELLLIDDGSNDNSGAICDEYAEKDSRIRVFHTENKGVSAARNLGIREASADWVCFVDSDDWVESDYLYYFNDDKVSSGNSLICQQIYVEYKSEQQEKVKKVPYLKSTFFYPFNEDQIMDNKILEDVYVLAKLFNLRLIREKNIHFSEKISICEDVVFYRTYLQYVKIVYLCTANSYHYVQRNINSLSRKFHKPEERIFASDAMLSINDAILKNFSITNANYIKKQYTLFGLRQLYAACLNVDRSNFHSIFNYVYNKKCLFDKYYSPVNIEQRIFKICFFKMCVPHSIVYFAIKFYLRLFK